MRPPGREWLRGALPRAESDRERLGSEDAERGPPRRLAVKSQVRHALGEDRECLLHLRSGQAGEPAVIFTAHGLPERIVKAGDPYVEQVDASCRALASALGLGQGDWELGFQSRVGPLAWIGPGTDELIVAAAEAKKAILVVPVAFVSEHSETLVELDMDYGKLAADHGAAAYMRVATVGTHPAFIAGLARMVREAETAAQPIVAFGAGCSASAAACPMRMVPAGPTTKDG